MKEELLSKVDELKSSQEAMQSDMTAKLEEEVLAQVADLKTSQDAMQSDLSAKIEEEVSGCGGMFSGVLLCVVDGY